MDVDPEAGRAAQPTREAVGEVLAALAYALLRVFEISAAAGAGAPTMSLREAQAGFAVDQWERYQVLRTRLGSLTVAPEEALERFRPALDSFYERVSPADWLEAQVFHFVGEAITADFAELLAPRLDDDTAEVVRRALSGRERHAAFALGQVRAAMASGGEETERRVGTIAGRVVGDAITHLREAMLASTTLTEVLGSPDELKDIVLELLGRHRERLDQLGVDPVE